MVTKIIYTLVFVRENSKVLLGLKKYGLGVNKWNGFGGKVEKGETIIQGAIRELQEESSLVVSKLNHIGVLVYEDVQKSCLELVHVFTAHEYKGEPTESKEMDPKWYDIQYVPFNKMWPDAKVWFPRMLKDQYFLVHILSTNEQPKIQDFQSLDDVLNTIQGFNV